MPKKDNNIGGYGKLTPEIVNAIGEIVDDVVAIQKPNYGKTTLFWAIVHTINRHLDTKKVARK